MMPTTCMTGVLFGMTLTLMSESGGKWPGACPRRAGGAASTARANMTGRRFMASQIRHNPTLRYMSPGNSNEFLTSGLHPLALEPRQRCVRNFLPTAVHRERVPPIREHLVIRHARRLAVQLVGGTRYHLRHGVVLAAARDQQRATRRLRVHLRRRVREDIGECRFEQRLTGRRNVILGMQRVVLLLRDGVAETEVELFRRLRDRLRVVERIPQHRERALELGQRERQHAADLRGVERDRGRREPHPQQLLRDETAERVPDDDGLRGKFADDRGVMLDDVVDAHVGQALRMCVGFGDRRRLTRPPGGGGVVARGAEQLDPGLPGIGMEPQAMDEDYGGAGGGHNRHGRSSRVLSAQRWGLTGGSARLGLIDYWLIYVLYSSSGV